MTNNEKLYLSLALEGKLKQKFQDIQQFLGLHNKADTMRYLIKQFKLATS